MKSATLLIVLLTAGITFSESTAAPLRTDEPGNNKEQPKRMVKKNKLRVPLISFGRKKETSYARAVRRNEVLREPKAE